MHLFVGDITDDTAQAAQTVSADAYLITGKNCDYNHTGVCYTSLGDMPNEKTFIDLLHRADKITIVDRDVWSDGKTKSDLYSMAWNTINYCKTVESQNKFVPTPRLSQNSCMWLAGCSTTAGVGLDFKRQRYGFLVAEELDLELIDLSQPSSSLEWSANQIMQSDLKSGDVVVWGLTSNAKISYFYNDKLWHIASPNYPKHKKWLSNYITPGELNSDNRYYSSIQHINCVKNICHKLDVKLTLVSIHCDIGITGSIADDNFVFVHGQKGPEPLSSYLDVGNDQLHPGPLTHQMYAQRILEHMEKRNG